MHVCAFLPFCESGREIPHVSVCIRVHVRRAVKVAGKFVHAQEKSVLQGRICVPDKRNLYYKVAFVSRTREIFTTRSIYISLSLSLSLALSLSLEVLFQAVTW